MLSSDGLSSLTDNYIPPELATHRSDCPYAPSDPRWSDWTQAFLRTHWDRDAVVVQKERMRALKASTPQPTKAQLEADAIMAEIEDYNSWVEAGQPGQPAEAAAQVYAFEDDVFAKLKALQGGGTSFPDALDNIVNAFGGLFNDVAQALKTVFADIWELLKHVIHSKKDKTDGGYIPRSWEYWQCEDYDEEQRDQRPLITMYTWLQYDAI